MIANPRISIIIAGFIVTLVMTLVTKYFTDQKRLKELKAKQKEHEKKMKEHQAKGDMESYNKLQKEVLQQIPEMMKHSFKPILITFLPIILMFSWLRSIYSPTELGQVSFLLPGWVWWYLGSAIISSIILRKVLDVA